MVSVFALEVFDVDAGLAAEEKLSLLGAESGRSVHAIRAVSSVHVLKGFSRAFAENGKPKTESEAALLYGLSQETDAVDHFISHSWSAGRIWKWAAMSDHYHRVHAFLIANAVSAVVTLLGLLWRAHTREVVPVSVAFCVCTLLPAAVAVAVVACGHSIFSGAGSMVFLDRLCIHQWDEELKQQGVRSLGDVLRKSQKMMVLWSDDYMERLWCIFEIATFSAHKKPRDMVFIPLWMTPFLYAVIIGCTLMLLFSSLFHAQGLEVSFTGQFMDFFHIRFGGVWGMRFFLAHGVPAIPLCYVIRTAVMRKAAMMRWVAEFTLEHTKLTVEDDRTFIYDHIDRLFGSTNAFEEFVRIDVLQMLNHVIGPAWQVPYAWGIFVFQPYLWYIATDNLSSGRADVGMEGMTTWEEYVIYNYMFFAPFYLLMPLVLKLVALSARCTMRWPFGVGLLVDVIVFMQGVMTCSLVCWKPVLVFSSMYHR